jgi:hypothetical protein
VGGMANGRLVWRLWALLLVLVLLNCECLIPGFAVVVTNDMDSVLSVVTLAFFGMGLHKHRLAGKPFILGGANSSHLNGTAPVIVEPEAESKTKDGVVGGEAEKASDGKAKTETMV